MSTGDHPTARLRAWAHILGDTSAVLLGLVFLVAGGLKAADPASFYSQIRGYGLVGHVGAKLGAMFLPGVELGLGTWAVLGPRRQVASGLLAGLLLVFLGATAHAWATGSTDNCGCFGEFVTRSPRETFFEDLVLLTLAGIASALARSYWPWKKKTSYGMALAGLVGLGGFGLGIANGSASLAASGRLSEGLSVSGWRIEANPARPKATRVPPNLLRGVHVVVFMSPLCKHCWQAVPDVVALQTVKKAKLLVLLPDDSPPRVTALFLEHMEQQGARFPVYLMPAAQFRRLVDGTPTTALIVTGVVRAALDGIPRPKPLADYLE